MAEPEVLDETRCWELLAAAPYGRLAFGAEGRIEVLPLNHLVADGAIYLRSAPGSKLRHVGHAAPVAFEVDGTGPDGAWSVVAHGRVARLDDDAEIEASGVQRLATWHPGEKFNYLRVTVEEIAGRSFPVAG